MRRWQFANSTASSEFFGLSSQFLVKRRYRLAAILNLHELNRNKLFLNRTRKDLNFKRPPIYATLFQIENCCLEWRYVLPAMIERIVTGWTERLTRFRLSPKESQSRRVGAFVSFSVTPLTAEERSWRSVVQRF